MSDSPSVNDLGSPSGSPPPAPASAVPRPLKFPPAVTIRSGPAPARLPLDVDPYAAHEARLPKPGSPPATVYAPLPRAAVWAEWNINPAKHGPERVKGPPVFVQSQGNYDDLGRSTVDGVDVDVEQGKLDAEGRKGQSGEEVAAWYAALSRAGSGASTPAADPAHSTARARHVESVRPVVKVAVEHAIDLTADSDDDEATGDAGEDVKTAPTVAPTQAGLLGEPLRVDPKEWYIRRALYKSHITNGPGPAKPFKSTSIGSLLGVTQIQVKAPAPQYVLGPENKGYDILKNTLGWGGGGLGKPVGWTPTVLEDDSNAVAGPSRHASSLADQLAADDLQIKSDATRDTSPAELNGVVHLTGDSESEESDLDDEVPEGGPAGPGRTVPVSTMLKLDRLGLGHRRGLVDRKGNSLKRVTHTHEQIEAAQRRAKKRVMEQNNELGAKGKIKWKEKDKRDVQERRRIAAALNA